eukprot:CAMPEP_0198727878 /NCGR_PEP_ID=MMETSP1475-20131203/6021_1 /TAXON_ID= ORGANISM="Unidentified sp., Strain CCMP1999" /NCGR_SAMPLE_ID=MMETSP1475 /ASSEMBLY_ACC=CAM_ASM_001111 /LENGTH=95 /DNA_ID=CAMNT_0044490071 /DNA_START=239 /DNA_END=526 /DNA_ORIENTATION=-
MCRRPSNRFCVRMYSGRFRSLAVKGMGSFVIFAASARLGNSCLPLRDPPEASFSGCAFCTFFQPENFSPPVSPAIEPLVSVDSSLVSSPIFFPPV